jgi:hypothetical protein
MEVVSMESATNENTSGEVRILSRAGSDESPENADGMDHRVSQRNFPGNPCFNSSEKSKKVQKEHMVQLVQEDSNSLG